MTDSTTFNKLAEAVAIALYDTMLPVKTPILLASKMAETLDLLLDVYATDVNKFYRYLNTVVAIGGARLNISKERGITGDICLKPVEDAVTIVSVILLDLQDGYLELQHAA